MTSHSLKSRSVYFILRSVASKKQIITESNERKTGLRRLANNFPITVLLYLFNIIALHIYVGGNFFLNFYSKLWMFLPFLNVLLSDSFSCLLAGETKQTKHSSSRKKQKKHHLQYLLLCNKRDIKSEICRQGISFPLLLWAAGFLFPWQCVLLEWQLLDSLRPLSSLFSLYYLCPVGAQTVVARCGAAQQGGPQIPQIHTFHLTHRIERTESWQLPDSSLYIYCNPGQLRSAVLHSEGCLRAKLEVMKATHS